MKISVNIPDELIKRLDERWKRDGFGSRSDMIVDAIRLRTHDNFKIYVTQRGELIPPNWKERRDDYVESPLGKVPESATGIQIQSGTPKITGFPKVGEPDETHDGLGYLKMGNGIVFKEMRIHKRSEIP